MALLLFYWFGLTWWLIGAWWSEREHRRWLEAKYHVSRVFVDPDELSW